MSKTKLGMLIIALLTSAGGPNRVNRSQALLGSSEDYSGPAFGQSQPTLVEVTFDGLMVIRQVDSHYEVGVLEGQNTAPHHKFSVTVDGSPLPDKRVGQLLALGNTWSLDTVTSSGMGLGAAINARQVRSCNRKADTVVGQVDL